MAKTKPIQTETETVSTPPVEAAPAEAEKTEAPAPEVAKPEAPTEKTVEVNGQQYTVDKETGAMVSMKQDVGSNPNISPSEFVTEPVRDTSKAQAKLEVKTTSGCIRKDY